jgi:hypothetical protein
MRGLFQQSALAQMALDAAPVDLAKRPFLRRTTAAGSGVGSHSFPLVNDHSETKACQFSV